jgi:hypothetical protein
VTFLLGCQAQPPRTTLDDEAPRLVNAFFGLDDALPDISRWLCGEAPGQDGMPVTFSHRVQGCGRRGEVEASAFRVVTRSGTSKAPVCAVLAPAIEASERHTVLLVGDLGDAESDPPERVEVIGSIRFDSGLAPDGLSAAVTPLEEGPTLVLAMAYRPDAIDSDCPSSTKQLVVVVWAGGVQPGEGQSQETHRLAYRVSTFSGLTIPIALGDIDDQDNYVHLCLGTTSPATAVRARAGVLVDPRDDLNPETTVAVSR